MASLEEGYAKIANGILEAIYSSDMTLMQKEIVILVARFTYGYRRKMADLSYSFIATGIGRNKREVIRNVNSLIQKNVILRDESSRITNLGINRHTEEWDVKFRFASGAQTTRDSGAQTTSVVVPTPLLGSGAQTTEEIQTYKEKRINTNHKRASRPGDQSFPSLWDAYPKSKRDEAGKRFINGKILEEIEENAEAVQAALEIYLSEVKDLKYLQKASDFFRGNWKQYTPDEEENTEKKGRYE